MFRNFQLTDDTKLELRLEAFNFTNTPKFGNPSGNVNSTGFGEITSASEERQFQIGFRLVF